MVFDEFFGGAAVGHFDRDAIAVEFVAVVAFQVHPGPFAEPGLDFLFEIERFTGGVGGFFRLGDDRFAEVVDAADALGERVDVFLQFALGLNRRFKEDRRALRSHFGGVAGRARAATTGDEQR